MKRANRIEVDIVDGEIEIAQPPDEGSCPVVRVTADQVDQLIQWLQEKRDELNQAR